MKQHTFKQSFNASREELWDFISTPKNLNKITPPEMNFVIQSEIPEKMYKGLLIEYKIRLPFLGYQTWLTEIKYIEEGKMFVDEQRVGPYKLWHHRHELEEQGDKTVMTDTVTYSIGFGPIGTLVENLFVENEVRKIFRYRKKVLNQIFV